MPGNSFGELFRVTTAGVSHGPGYVAIIDGCPPGLPLSVDDLMPDLRRRRPGQSKIVTQRKEEDVPEIWSGVFEGKRSEEHTSELQSLTNLVCRLLLEKKKKINDHKASA